VSRRVTQLAWSIVTLVLAGGCNLRPAYALRIVDVPPLAEMPFHRIEEPIAEGADPYWQRDRQVAYFDYDLRALGILPVLLRVENRGERTLLARPSDVLLRLPDSTRVSPASPSSVTSRIQGDTSNLVNVLTYLTSFDSEAASAAGDQAVWDREADLKKLGLSEGRLDPGGTVRGFVYFVLPSAVRPFTEATIEVRFLDVEEGSSFVVPLALVMQGPEGP
jgi:hypothetical protein